jgi:hypothetical protein
MKEAAVGASADLVDDIGLEIGVDSPRDVLAVTCVGGVSNLSALKPSVTRLPVSEKKVLKP